MAASRIKGITIEIGGDTTKLQTALKGVNTEIRNTQAQLKDVEKLLKLDPGNTELLAQKHKLLGDAVKETKEKLETLKTAAEQAEKALNDGTISKDQYDALQREIIETENELKRLEEQANQSATALQKISATGEKLKDVGSNIEGAGKKLLPVTATVTALGTASVKTAADFEAAMSKVAAVSGATGSDLEALTKKAREMGSKTKFSASEAAEAMNYMAMAGWKTEDMLSGIEGVMNLAAAESLVGKNAMSGFLALMNAGEGDIAKLSGAIDNCNGAAQSMANTMNNNLEGQLTILKSQLQELAISFGEILLPAVKKIVGWVQGFINVLNSLPDGVKETIVTVALIAAVLGPVLIIIGKIITAVGTIMTIVPKVVGVIKAVKTAFLALNATMLANPIVLIIAAIAALGAAFIYLWNNCDEFRQFWIDLWESIKEIAVAVWEALKEFLVAAWEFIKITAETVWNALAGFFTGLWEGIKNTFTTVVNAISTFLSTMWNTIKSVAETIWNAISTFFTTIWNGIKTVVTTVVTAISTFLTTAWNTIKTVITTVLNAIKTAVSTAFSAMWNGIKNTISGIYNTIKNGFTNAVNFIKNLASSAFSWGADIINGIVNGIKSCIGKVKDAVCSVADTIKSFLHFSVPDEGPLTEYESWMPDFMSGLAKGIEKSKGMVKDAVSGLAADMVVNPQLNAGQMAMAGSGSVTSADMRGFVSAIKDAVSSVNGGSGDIVIPVYLGGTMLDEVIVNAQQRANLRSGGR